MCVCVCVCVCEREREERERERKIDTHREKDRQKIKMFERIITRTTFNSDRLKKREINKFKDRK